MKVDRFLLFASLEDASAFLDRLYAEMQYQGKWAEPNTHPFEQRVVLPWNDSYLQPYSQLLEGVIQISQEEAQDQGFLFGRLRGPFAHARAKLEEAQLLYDALATAAPVPNFPAYRSLFFGFLSATYALKEALRKSCLRLGQDAEQWWEGQYKRITNDPLISAFYDLNNSNKHSPGDLPLRSTARIQKVSISAGPKGTSLVMSNEGVFGILHQGTSRERVVTVNGFAEVNWLVVLEMSHRGISGSATELAGKVLRFYEELVFEARRTFGGEPRLMP